MSNKHTMELIAKLKQGLERRSLYVPSGQIPDFGFQIEKGETCSNVFLRDHRKNLNVDMCWQNQQRSRPPTQRIDGLYGTSFDPHTDHPIVTIELIGPQCLRIEPLTKKFEAHISGSRDAKLHLRSIFWDHESDGHTNQLMNPVVLEDYLSRELRVVSATDSTVHTTFRSLQTSDLPLLEIVPLINQYQTLVDKEYLEMVDPELAAAANPKKGDCLLEAAKENVQHLEAIKFLVELAEKFDWLKPLSPVIQYYIFFVGGSYEEIVRFFKSHERELQKDPCRESMLEFLRDKGYLETWWKNVECLFIEASLHAKNCEVSGPYQRIEALHGLFRQVKNEAFKARAHCEAPLLRYFNSIVFKPSAGCPVIFAAPPPPFGELALDHLIDSKIADDIIEGKPWPTCPFAGSVQTGCDRVGCRHTEKWRNVVSRKRRVVKRQNTFIAT